MKRLFQMAVISTEDHTYGIVFLGNHGKLENLQAAAAALGNDIYEVMKDDNS